MSTNYRRILIFLPDLRCGGAESLYIRLANYWTQQGHTVDFLLMSRRGELIQLVSEGVGIFELGIHRLRQVVLPLSQYLRRTRPDIFLAALWPLTSLSILAWIMAGKPGRIYVGDHAHLSVSCPSETNTHPLLLRSTIKYLYPLSDGIIAVSKGVKEDLLRLGSLAESHVRVIYNPASTGVDPTRLPISSSNNLWGSESNFNILSVGTLKSQKDHETLIRAFALLPGSLGATLTILGEGPLRRELEQLIIDLGITKKVRLPGFVLDPSPWFRSADLFVLSSLYEGFGNVLVEALECGVPVVSTDCPSGPSEILAEGKYGKLVPPGDTASLASAMTSSYIEEHDSQALIDRASAYSIQRISAQYLDYFSE